jgi:uncharacterized membrane protein
MEDRRRRRAFWVAVLFWVVVALVTAVFSFTYIGWLGVALLGLIGLLVSVRLDLHGGHAVPDTGQGTTAVGLYAKQIEEKKSSSPDQKLAEKERRAERSKLLYIINTVCMCLIIFGLYMFIRFQL